MSDDQLWTSLQRLESKLDSNSAATAANNLALARIETELKFRQQCSNPNLCVAMEPRIVELEKVLLKGSGSWYTLVTLGGVASALTALYLEYLKQ